MLINNKQPRLIDLGLENGRLMPGINSVTPPVWARVKDTHFVKQHLADGQLEIRVSDETGIEKLGNNKAVAVVKETFDAVLLRTWKYEDGRSQVREAIDEQLEKVKLPKTQDA